MPTYGAQTSERRVLSTTLVTRCGLRAAYDAAWGGSGRLAVVHDLHAFRERVPIAVGPLKKATATSRKVVHDLRSMQAQHLKGDILRHAGKHGLMSLEEVERWLVYRDNRNIMAHDYGEGFAEETLTLMPQFVEDAGKLEAALQEKLGNASA